MAIINNPVSLRALTRILSLLLTLVSTYKYTMFQSIKTTRLSLLLIKTGFLFFILSSSVHAGSQADHSGPIVVTIKPLYSLVAHLTEGIDKPVLLLKQMQSPHHYTMRPSERRLLANARMIIWTGPQMESYLDKVIRQQDTLTITAMQASDLKLLDRRTKDGHSHAAGEATPDELSIDPHIWLSTHNAIAISKHISQQLINTNPTNKKQYENNLQQLIDKISQLSAEIKASLESNKQAFISYHDAYQYFEDENQLNHLDTISFDEETGVSLKHLRHIKASIKNNGVTCLVYQPPEPAIVRALAEQTTIKTFSLDPLGQHINNGKQAWFEIMQDLALNFKQCLNAR